MNGSGVAKKQRAALIAGLGVLPPDARFDHPPLNTLVLAMPVLWKGTLQELLRMWDKRQRGYRAMGYRVGSDDSSDF
jgi:hypothetical protein